VGQYQLVPAVVETVGQKVVAQEHSLFRIDTKTGKTWSYASGQDKNGKIFEFWHEISDLPRDLPTK
jgi:hypothetical protein